MSSDTAASNYCIALQPICNARMQHIADELLYRASASANAAYVDDQVLATARVCTAAFYENGVEQLVGKRKLFFNAPRDWLLHPELLPPNPEQVVIEVLEQVKGEPEILAALKQVRSLGYDVALDDFVLTPETAPLLDVATIIKVDVLAEVSLADIDLYKQKGLRLLAEKVEDLPTFNRFKALGFDYFQGYFYARAEVRKATSRHRGSNEGAQLKILAELQEDEPNIQSLADLIVQDPALTYLLLKYVNSARYRRVNEVTTVHHALRALGLNRVKTIVTTVLLANNGPCNRLRLPQILARACMCETLADFTSDRDPRTAFIVGLLSEIDTMMDMPVEQIMAELPLSQEVKEAIVHQQGRLGEILALVLSFESAQFVERPDLSIEQLNQIWLTSQARVTRMLDDAF